jgi:hypothetical protein
MRRVTLMLVAMAVMVPLFAVVAYAAPGGNAANAHKCEEGGYLDYTDANGDPFKNEGQCTSYAARGGQLVPVPTTPDISINQETSTISGTGFTPNSQFTTELLYLPGGQRIIRGFTFSTDATGAFTVGAPGPSNFCITESTTGVQVVIQDSAGVIAAESFELSCGI